MTQQQWSQRASKALQSFSLCKPDEQRELIAHFSQLLTSEISKRASTASLAQLAEALAIVEKASLRRDTRNGVLVESNFRGVPAVEGRIVVDGQELDMLLPTVSCNQSYAELRNTISLRHLRWETACEGRYRFATTRENLEYIGRILVKAENGTINPAESEALRTYRELPVRSEPGGVIVEGLTPQIAWIGKDERQASVLLVRTKIPWGRDLYWA